MKFFTREELAVVSLILGLIILVSTPNYIVSLRRARDAQRKADLGSIHEALVKYQEDFGFFPLAKDGAIAACAPYEVVPKDARKPDGSLDVTVSYSACDWGRDSLADLSDPSYPPYLKAIPNDPQAQHGLKYVYFSNGSRFQVYAALEGKSEDEYDKEIIKRGINCGTKICNFGRAYGKTPLNKSIEEYESELLKLK